MNLKSTKAYKNLLLILIGCLLALMAYATPNQEPGSLTSAYNGKWQGYEGENIEITIDLGEEVPVSKISAGFLNKIESWIFLPITLTIEISEDGVNFSESNITRNVDDLNNEKVFVRDFQVLFETTDTRYVRLTAKNVGIVPDWHRGAGDKAWLFIDEIVVE